MGGTAKGHRKEVSSKWNSEREYWNRIEKADPMVICKYLKFKMRAKKRDTIWYTLHSKLIDKFECQTVILHVLGKEGGTWENNTRTSNTGDISAEDRQSHKDTGNRKSWMQSVWHRISVKSKINSVGIDNMSIAICKNNFLKIRRY